MEQNWERCEITLPLPFILVKCLLSNGCYAIDYVNQPDGQYPFAHYLVDKWRLLTEQELDEIVNNYHER